MKNRMKKMFLLSLSLIMVLMFSTIANANTDFVPEIDYSSEEIMEDGAKTYDILNKDEALNFFGIDEAKEIKVTLLPKEELGEIPTQRFWGYQIINVRGPFQACGRNEFTRNSTTNNSPYTIRKAMTVSGSASNSYSVNVGIDADIISAELGFDVTRTVSLSDSTDVELRPGQSVTVYGYPLLNTYNFDARSNWDHSISRGSASEVVGVCTVVR